MRFLNNVRIGIKLRLLLAIFIAGYGIYALYSIHTLNVVRIEGQLYQEIIMGKDLIADIMPPPEYIVESYLDVLRMSGELNSGRTDASEMRKYIGELHARKTDFDERHTFWVQEKRLETGPLRTAFLEESYPPAVRFFDAVFTRFIPAAEQGDYELARDLALGDLRAAFLDHRAAIERTVSLAERYCQDVENRAAGRAYRDTLAQIALALTMIALSSFFGAMISRSISLPLSVAAVMLKDISEGEGDLTKGLVITGQGSDELGKMTQYFNATLGKIKNLVETIRETALKLSAIGGNLSSRMIETGAEITQISGHIASIKERIEGQAESVRHTSAEMERILHTTSALSASVAQQNKGISTCADEIGQMLNNIRHVTKTLKNNGANVIGLSAACESGRAGVMEVSADIKEIAKESEGLLEINGIMANIASQTNLLSMNAAIEAAHAGASGRGFAVVADEIRKLAENAGEQSKIIGGVLKKIHSSIGKISISTETALNQFETVDAHVKTVAREEELILTAMEEQTEGSHRLLHAQKALREFSQSVQESAQTMRQNAEAVAAETRELDSGAREIKTNMDEIADGAERISRAASGAQTIAGQNEESIAVLVAGVSRFKTR
jgi:methyl-accepting chemotaxis protein